VPRHGRCRRAGVELALPSNWSARLEYLFTDFTPTAVSPSRPARSVLLDLTVSELRFGLTTSSTAIELGQRRHRAAGCRSSTISPSTASPLFQSYVFPFRNPYSGQNSLDPTRAAKLGIPRVSRHAAVAGCELWVNPEIDQVSLERDARPSRIPQRRGLQKSALRYLTASSRYLSAKPRSRRRYAKSGRRGQPFSGSQTANRLVLTVGKFAVTDIFDTNKYAHDPRSDFMNWALIDTGTFDYASDAWGFTYGAAGRVVPGRLDRARRPIRSVGGAQRRRARPAFRAIPMGRRDRAPLRLMGPAGKIAVTDF